jgi:MFS transporter, MHS family, shikimate and dehydroshikimate transport protein
LRWRSVASNRQRAAYAVGFLDRLIGVVDGFGYLGDKYGRKPVLIATLLLMGLSTAVIGLLPSTMRSASGRRSCCWFFQRFGAGAEYSGAVLFAPEYSPNQRGVFAN